MIPGYFGMFCMHCGLHVLRSKNLTCTWVLLLLFLLLLLLLLSVHA